MTSRHYIAAGSIAVVLCIAAFFGVFGAALRQGDDNLKVFLDMHTALIRVG